VKLADQLLDFTTATTHRCRQRGGWSDVFLEGTVSAHASFRAGPAGEHARLVLMPWWHAPHGRYVGALDYGEQASAD
jgi:predicted acyl esterase